MQRAQDLFRPRYGGRLLRQPPGVQLVALRAVARDLLRRQRPAARQVPGPLGLDQEQLVVLLARQLDAEPRHRVARRLEVDPLGVDEDAVVVPEQRARHGASSLATRGASSRAVSGKPEPSSGRR